jgi:excisionase family DNA binding protein
MPAYLSARRAAKQLGVSDRTVRLWIESGKLPAERGEYGYRIAVEQLEGLRGRGPYSGAKISAAADSEPENISAPADRDRFAELVGLVERQQQTILELSGRCGFYQAQVEQLRETVKALEAPKMVPELSLEGSGHSEPAIECSEPVSWWRRLFKG